MRFVSLVAAALIAQAAQVPNKVAAKAVKVGSTTIRIYNATQSAPDAKLDILLDGAPVASAVAADTLAGPFTPKDPPNAKLAFKKPQGAANLLELPVDAADKDHVLVLLGDPDKTLDIADLVVKPAPGAEGKTSINILSAIPKEDAGDDIDVYVLGAEDKLDAAMPTAKGVSFNSAASVDLAPGTYTVVVTKTGAKDILAQSEAIDAKANTREAVLALPKGAGKADKVFVVNL